MAPAYRELAAQLGMEHPENKKLVQAGMSTNVPEAWKDEPLTLLTCAGYVPYCRRAASTVFLPPSLWVRSARGKTVSNGIQCM